MIQLDLPKPPSLNGIFRNTSDRRRPRVKTQKYHAWRADAFAAILEQGRPRIHGPYDLEIMLQQGRYTGDLGNYEKAISDALVDARVVEDDSLMQRLVLFWAKLPEGIDCTVIVRPAEAKP